MLKISFVLPTYNESESIEQFYSVLKHECSQRDEFEYEFIFINDGSSDDSLEKLKDIQEQDEEVKIIDFSRNFGHQAAITAGMDFATGDAVIIMDTDLQDPPIIALELVDKWQEGYQVVYAKRRSRKDSFLKQATANGFYWLIDKLTKFDLPRNVGDFRLLDKKVVKSVNLFREHNRYMRGIVAYVGYRQTAHLFDRDERFAGETKYPLAKMLKLALDGIFSFSTLPLKFITQLGLFVSFLSFIGIVYALAMYFFRPDITVPGWTMQTIAILFIGGVQMLMLGILGEYIGRIYGEVQNRPLYLINEIIE